METGLIRKKLTRWWFQNIFLCSPLFGEDSHFDEHIFQMGWFNHQLVKIETVNIYLFRLTEPFESLKCFSGVVFSAQVD